MNKVGVYGTLREGLRLHGYLKGERFLYEATYPLPYEMRDCGWFPALVRSEETNSVTLEVYEVDDATLSLLDQVEGVPDLYVREVVYLGGEEVWVYVFSDQEYGETLPLIPGGDYKEYESLRVVNE